MDEEALYKLVGEKIRKFRDRKGISQAKLAQKLGMTRTSVVNIEAGRQRPPLHVLWQIAEVLETETALLIPKQAEYREQGQPISLDSTTVAEIEKAANGDPVARRDLEAFIGKIKTRGKARYEIPIQRSD